MTQEDCGDINGILQNISQFYWSTSSFQIEQKCRLEKTKSDFFACLQAETSKDAAAKGSLYTACSIFQKPKCPKCTELVRNSTICEMLDCCKKGNLFSF